jgi:hypothetical protein
MSIPAQSPPAQLAPPPPPAGTNPALINYLQQYTAWIQNQLAGKVGANGAQNGVMLQASDAPPGTIPAVFHLQVQTDGTLVATPVPLGGSNPT